MKRIVAALSITLFVACSSQPRQAGRVPTYQEAVAESGELPEGTSVVNNSRGVNHLVTVQDLHAQNQDLERQIWEKNRENEFLKQKVTNLENENNLLRTRMNVRLEKENKQIMGWDNQGNPVVKTTVEPANPDVERVPASQR